MKKKNVTIEVSYDTEETWEEAKKEIEEIMDMMNNIKRKARITNIDYSDINMDGFGQINLLID